MHGKLPCQLMLAWLLMGTCLKDRKLIAIVDHREGNVMHLRLVNPADPATGSDKLASINGVG